MTWTGLHVRLSWAVEHVDAFIADALAPAMAAHRADGGLADWFYLRYWQTGPHLRVRVKDARVDLAAQLRDLVAAADFPVVEPDPDAFYTSIGAAPGAWLPHGDVRPVEYEPEVRRYGGPELLPLAEDVFCRSTEVAAAVLRVARTPTAKVNAAVELVMATTLAMKLDRLAASAWLRALAAGWRQAREPSTPPTVASHSAARRLHEAWATGLSARWDRLSTGATGVVAYWMAQVRPDVPPYVWASQLHMLLNRLGIGPDEERTLCWLVAATAAAPDGLAPFHEDGVTAADRRYLEASRFVPGVAAQLPREDAAPEAPSLWLGTVDLPPGDPPAGSLVEALRSRRTGRGADLGGPLDAARLATLLWTAQGAFDDGHRPYPSAGARYSARLRLVALDVTGLAAGVYDVDEVGRRLVAVAPAPSAAELAATSMWFGPADSVPAGVEVAALPALLGLYVRFGPLRRTYGLRAARLAFAEAGHLAQNLALVAASAGLSLGVLGGFYDDLAHDVFVLDGVDDTLVYLLPVGSPAGPEV
ncbi:thiopeptide-type bacteriocin biosynthesis protein [Saccharothrix sp. 6-C]|uniref:thiopeptide-type bacteriocin biosynthesis protein n=1 Tax=Saccharothrix sp. 6-C TaxID=2781735 RepID=UPI001917279A|nr:thiopeptide-type bacteriocin biosynthesis protein [Saccharothrix sp. 6-C]QQQ73380.1 thiopeptide-type bacteriocin biosynthesis protein [Saccharothrix sp. 6-C]